MKSRIIGEIAYRTVGVELERGLCPRRLLVRVLVHGDVPEEVAGSSFPPEESKWEHLLHRAFSTLTPSSTTISSMKCSQHAEVLHRTLFVLMEVEVLDWEVEWLPVVYSSEEGYVWPVAVGSTHSGMPTSKSLVLKVNRLGSLPMGSSMFECEN